MKYVLLFDAAFHDVVHTLIDRWFNPTVPLGGAHRLSNLERGGSVSKRVSI